MLLGDLRAALGDDGVDTRPPRLAECAVDGVAPAAVVTPASRQQVAAAVRAVETAAAAMIARGSGTHAGVGQPPRRYDVALCTRGLARVIKHDAADMTVTVESGVTLAALDEALGRAGQWLPLDPPRPDLVTVGGLLAADLNGGLRFSHGKARDYLIGVRAVIGGGVEVRGGGEVVKNVAGYDLPKLMIGSYGTLGVIVEATFKVRPRPPADSLLVAAAADVTTAVTQALALLVAPLAPFAIDVCCAAAAAAIGLPPRPHLLVRLGGESVEVRDQRDRLAGLVGKLEEAPPSIGRGVRDFSLAGAVVCRLSALPSDVAALLAPIAREAEAFGVAVQMLAHAGSGVLRLQVDAAEPLPFLRWLRYAVRQRGGHLIVDRLPAAAKRDFDVWGEPPAPLDLARRVKEAIDPRAVFSPGRFVGGL